MKITWKVKHVNELMFKESQVNVFLTKKGNNLFDESEKLFSNTKYCIKETLGKVIPSFQLISKIKLAQEDGEVVELLGKIESLLNFVDNVPTFEYKVHFKEHDPTKSYLFILVA